jgi:predicted TIM-barrel fold metal-dependent hydrolase
MTSAVDQSANGGVRSREDSGRPYLVVSTDGHAGPRLDDLRGYCPPAHRDDFDAFTRTAREEQRTILEGRDTRPGLTRYLGLYAPPNVPRKWKDAVAHHEEARGQYDAHERLRFMDQDGIAADVVFPGSQNGEPLPFHDPRFRSPEGNSLTGVGMHIWNQWLADYVSVCPERLVGPAHLPIWDLEASISELKWAREAGLTAVNFPAPRRDFPSYNSPAYEPFWSTVEELDVPLLTHVGGGDLPLGADFEGGPEMMKTETSWLSRRVLWQLIFGGVFRRHPKLKLVITELRPGWIADTLRQLDGVYSSDSMLLYGGRESVRELDPRLPSEYWHTNCYLGASFLAKFEVPVPEEVGVHKVMWGADYPHFEGVWPHTRLAMRQTFAGLPEDEARVMLGESAVDVYGLDRKYLRDVAQRVGPRPEELAVPVAPSELPETTSQAFRLSSDYV